MDPSCAGKIVKNWIRKIAGKMEKGQHPWALPLFEERKTYNANRQVPTYDFESPSTADRRRRNIKPARPAAIIDNVAGSGVLTGVNETLSRIEP